MRARVCPGCGRPDPVANGQRLWPAGWICPGCRHQLPVRDGIGLTAPVLADTVTGFDPADFDFLARAELDHFWFVARRRLILALADKYAAGARSFLKSAAGRATSSERSPARAPDSELPAPTSTRGVCRWLAPGCRLRSNSSRQTPVRCPCMRRSSWPARSMS